MDHEGLECDGVWVILGQVETALVSATPFRVLEISGDQSCVLEFRV